MLSIYRLRKSADIQSTCQSGIVVATETIVFRIRDNGLDFPRMAFKLGKRTLKLAVHRNRAKRLHRACLQAKAALFSGKDIVVIGRKKRDKNLHITHTIVEQQWNRLVKATRQK